MSSRVPRYLSCLVLSPYRRFSVIILFMLVPDYMVEDHVSVCGPQNEVTNLIL